MEPTFLNITPLDGAHVDDKPLAVELSELTFRNEQILSDVAREPLNLHAAVKDT